MKIQHFVLTAGLLALSSGLFAFDAGLILDTTNDAYTHDVSDIDGAEDFVFETLNTATLNLKVPFNNDGSQYIATEGNFAFKYWNDEAKENNTLKKADLTLLKYTGVFNTGSAKSVVSVGRFFVADSTGIVLSQTSDGISYQYLGNKLNIGAYGGYTGLLNGQNVTILGRNDSDYALDTDKLYYLDDSFVLGSLSVSFPYLLFNQTVGLEGLALIGVNGTNSDNNDYYRFYGTAMLNGPLAPIVFYRLYATLEKEKEEDMSLLSGITLDVYPPWLGMNLSLGAVYASASSGSMGSFKGITSQKATYAYSEPQYSELLKAGGSLSLKIGSPVFFKVGGDAVFTYYDDEGEATDDMQYNGFQVYANLTCQIYTDLRLNLLVSDYESKYDEDDKQSVTFSLTMSL